MDTTQTGSQPQSTNYSELGRNDPLYEKAVQVVRANRRVSISRVQRHLQIGYNRAALLLEAMVGTVIDQIGPDAKLLPEQPAGNPPGCEPDARNQQD